MLYRRWWTVEESDLNLHSFGKTDGGNDLAFYDCSVLERVLSGNGSKYKNKAAIRFRHTYSRW